MLDLTINRWRHPFVSKVWLEQREHVRYHDWVPNAWTQVDVPEEKRLTSKGDWGPDSAQCRYLDERHNWILDNIQNPVYTPDNCSYYFQEPNDAMLFKLSVF